MLKSIAITLHTIITFVFPIPEKKPLALFLGTKTVPATSMNSTNFNAIEFAVRLLKEALITNERAGTIVAL